MVGWNSEEARLALERRWPQRTEWERYIEKVAPPDANGCMLWTAGTRKGYGVLKVRRNGRWVSDEAHRVGWKHRFGPIPDGLFICHKCDIRACQNPDHWFLGSCADNLADMRAKNRGSKPPLNPYASRRLTWDDVNEIRRRYAAGGVRQSDLAHEFGVDQTNISAIIRGKSWHHPPAS